MNFHLVSVILILILAVGSINAGYSCGESRVDLVSLIPDTDITASSYWNQAIASEKKTKPQSARLNQQVQYEGGTIVKNAGWSSQPKQVGEWIQAKFDKPKMVEGIVTQGRGSVRQWVTSYRAKYSMDGENWTDYPEELKGNNDMDTEVTNIFDEPFKAQYVRIYPQTWYNHISLRFAVLGCKVPLCEMPMDAGSGTEKVKRYWYNADLKKCENFTYLGTGGNENNFRKVSDCLKECDPNSICLLPNEKGKQCGEDKNVQVRYAYIANKNKCKKFKYKGCEGNANNFETKEACFDACT